jgi:AmpD protein
MHRVQSNSSAEYNAGRLGFIASLNFAISRLAFDLNNVIFAPLQIRVKYVRVDAEIGLLDAARFVPTAHCSARPALLPIDMIVLHGISLPPGQFGSNDIEKFFLGELDPSAHPYFETIKDLKVSAHLFINREGEISQFVPFNLRAHHAGVSHFQGRENCNDFSIGIELEGTDDVAYTKIQYECLAQVINALRKAYPDISRDRIVGHSDIAPGRKTDPGHLFAWSLLDCLLLAYSA